MRFYSKCAVILFAIAGILIGLLTGYRECVSTEHEEVDAVIISVYYRPFYQTPVKVGSTYTFVQHSARYRTTVRCKYGDFTLNDSGTYYTYRDKIGKTVVGVLRTDTYDNGDVKRKIISIQEKGGTT